LETTLAHQDKEIKKLEITLARSDSVDVSVLSQQLDDARTHLASLEQGLRRKRGLLGVDEQLDLKRLQENNFLRMRMNALALKERIRDRLRQRKFEIEKLE
jgi:acetate kinase